MKRWMNGLPGATTRLGAKTAHRGLAASQLGCARIPMLVRSKIALLRDLIHCCSSHVRRSRRSVLQRTAGPYILALLGRNDHLNLGLLIGVKQTSCGRAETRRC